MKKIFIILISIGMISFSCDTPDNSPTVIGFSTGENGERSDIRLESDVAEVWVEYLKAHNDRDYAKISEMNSEDIEVWGPAGQYIKGNEAHIEFLKEWVAATDVKWTPQWFINNTGENTVFIDLLVASSKETIPDVSNSFIDLLYSALS